MDSEHNGAELSPLIAQRLLVTGQVQGVGFRPFVHALTRHFHLNGGVWNSPDGVTIHIEGAPEDIAGFRTRLVCDGPIAPRIENLLVECVDPAGFQTFTIHANATTGLLKARVPCDLAVCATCRNEVRDPRNRRHRYAFTSCSTCGPSYSTITDMPYDRSSTSMRAFPMCGPCTAEYSSPLDRRFHAQASACKECGPQLSLRDSQGRCLGDGELAVQATVQMLREGRIIAIKGLGGFQLLARADRSDILLELRRRKHRPTKPFAVMVSSAEAAEEVAIMTASERRLLESVENPIVLVKPRQTAPMGGLAEEIAPNAGTIGLLLPTTPLHDLLLAQMNQPLIATSGNRGAEPIVVDEQEAVEGLQEIADCFLIHDRPVLGRVDDSVVRVIDERCTTIRLARGLAPLSLRALEGNKPLPILAVGGQQKTAVAFWSGCQAVLGPHSGDMDNPESRLAFEKMVRDFCRLYRFEPSAIACDLHPDFFTTQWALAQSLPVVKVQHHHAHAVACMVEHGLLDQEVLAFTWDGTGYGSDGVVWGGECLQARCDGFDRVASLLPFPLPGGEAAIRHPGRIAFGLLYVLLGEDAMNQDNGWSARLGLAQHEAQLLASMIKRNVRTPWTSSVGRLFDALAAIILGIRQVSYEGEAAVHLEAVADLETIEAYDVPLLRPGEYESTAGDSSCIRGDWRPLVRAVLDDLSRSDSIAIIAARFHNALARWARELAGLWPGRAVVLSGGCFQNRLLAERVAGGLREQNRQVYLHGEIPPGDGGLAAGQLAVALTNWNSHL
ncbi:carbamoyltransferase HypF [soil metagenome]